MLFTFWRSQRLPDPAPIPTRAQGVCQPDVPQKVSPVGTNICADLRTAKGLGVTSRETLIADT